MCLCRNSCLPKGLANWTLIYNLPLEAKLEGDSSCLQRPLVQEDKPLLPRSCPQWGSLARATASSPGGLSFSGICCHSQEIEYGMGEGMTTFLFQCRWTVFTRPGVKQHNVLIATMGSAWQHLHQILWALRYTAAVDATRNRMFVLLYVPAVGMKGTNCTSSESCLANCASRYVPLERNPHERSGYMASCVAPSYLFFVWARHLVVL